MQITVTKSQTLKPKPDETNLGFGTIFTDHMFNLDYSVEKGWHNPRIEPYAAIPMDPSTTGWITGDLRCFGLPGSPGDRWICEHHM